MNFKKTIPNIYKSWGMYLVVLMCLFFLAITFFTVNSLQKEKTNYISKAQSSLVLTAFPGAEGFGAKATGGRGGAVIKVTNLNTSGMGSLQWAVDQPGARVIVFGVSGVIPGDVRISHGDITIAGQTAPGAGITINGHLSTQYGTTFGNIIVRHIRVRPPGLSASWPAGQHDSIQFSTNNTMILDHVDMSYGVDETVDMWGGARDITVQWSAITFPDTASSHNVGFINGPGGGRVSIHHNLFAHSRSRNPALSDGPSDTVNNVVYNFREGFVHHNPVAGDFNIIGNYFKSGSNAATSPLWFDPENTPTSRYFVSDNYVDHPGKFVGIVNNPYTTAGFSTYSFACCGITSAHFNYSTAFDYSSFTGYAPLTVNSPQTAYTTVLDKAGTWPRDIVNRWAVDDVKNRTGVWGARRPANFMDGLNPGVYPADVDNDGIADSWEASHGLSSSNPNDYNSLRPSGYTAIEEYINELADSLTGATTTPPPSPSEPTPTSITTPTSTPLPTFTPIPTPTPTPIFTPTPTPTSVPTPTPTKTPTPTPVPTGNGLTGLYFPNRTLSGAPTLARIDPAVNFIWATGAPSPALPSNNFSVRWTGYVMPQYSQQYTFYTQSDDGVRVWVNGIRIINNWTDHGSTENSGKINLTAGVKYTIKLEYYEKQGNALIQLRWSSPSQAKVIILQSRLYSN